MSDHDPALTLTVGVRSWPLDDAQLVLLRWAHGHWGSARDLMGKLLLSGGTVASPHPQGILAFVAAVRSHSGDELRAYIHGRGSGNLRLEDKEVLAVVDELGLRYRKTVVRYVKGQKGVIDRYE